MKYWLYLNNGDGTEDIYECENDNEKFIERRKSLKDIGHEVVMSPGITIDIKPHYSKQMIKKKMRKILNSINPQSN